MNRRRSIFHAAVVSNHPLCDEHFLLRLDVGPDFPPTAPGQFVQLQCTDAEADVSPVARDWPADAPPRLEHPELVADQAMLRRPFSLGGRTVRDGRVVLEVILRVVGLGTAWLGRLQAGGSVNVLGPLGNRFTWSSRTTQAVLVGGGVGVPPMLYLAKQLADAGIPTVAFIGARSANLMPLTVSRAVEVGTAGCPTLCAEQFAAHGVESALCTDDGSLGFAGLVTDALWEWIGQGRVEPGRASVYTCGPELMMRAVAQGCLARGIGCQVAMERQMACGMGTCQSCVCKTRADNEAGWVYKLVCTDGPVFDAADLVWDAPEAEQKRREEHGKDRPEGRRDRK